jgi:hypothetical protein
MKWIALGIGQPSPMGAFQICRQYCRHDHSPSAPPRFPFRSLIFFILFEACRLWAASETADGSNVPNKAEPFYEVSSNLVAAAIELLCLNHRTPAYGRASGDASPEWVKFQKMLRPTGSNPSDYLLSVGDDGKSTFE